MKVGLYKRKVVDNTTCDQYLNGVENEVHAVWGCDCIQSTWDAPFEAIRLKHPRLEAVCDLVSIVHDETSELDKFAMVAWAIWQHRNKLWSKETSTPVKIYKSALTLLAEFQLKKPRFADQSLT